MKFSIAITILNIIAVSCLNDNTKCQDPVSTVLLFNRTTLYTVNYTTLTINRFGIGNGSSSSRHNNDVQYVSHQPQGQIITGLNNETIVQSLSTNEFDNLVEVLFIYKNTAYYCARYSMADSNHKFNTSTKANQYYTFIDQFDNQEIKTMKVVTIRCPNRLYPYWLVFTANANNNRYKVTIFSKNNITGNHEPTQAKVMAVFVVNVDSDADMCTVSVYLIYDNHLSALYTIHIHEDKQQKLTNKPQIRAITRSSSFRSNSIWSLGFPECHYDICLDNTFKAIIIDDNYFHIFIGQTWLRQSRMDGKLVSEPLAKRIDRLNTVYVDPRDRQLYVIQDTSILRFNQNSMDTTDNNQNKDIGSVFPLLKQTPDAVQCIPIKGDCYVFLNDWFWLYSLKSDDNQRNTKFVLNGKFELKTYGLPVDGFDAAFVDENGDRIHLKNNYIYWLEYGVWRQYVVQHFLNCSDQRYYRQLPTDEINSWQKFSDDIRKQNPTTKFVETKFPTIPLPIADDKPTTPVPVSNTTDRPDSSAQLTNTTEKDGNSSSSSVGISLIIILLIVGFVIGLLVLIGLTIWCVYRYLNSTKRTPTEVDTPRQSKVSQQTQGQKKLKQKSLLDKSISGTRKR